MANPLIKSQGHEQIKFEMITSIQSIDIFQQLIKRIYAKKIKSSQFELLIDNIKFQFGYGTIYSIIRQNLQHNCKNQRKLIADSLTILCSKSKDCYRFNIQAKFQHDQLQSMKVTETIVRIIYFYYVSLAQSNKNICLLWQRVKKLEQTKKPQDINIRIPELKLSTLNLLTLKQLLPPSNFICLTDFRSILQRLINCKYVIQKNYVKQMLILYQQSQIYIQKPEVDHQVKINKQNEKIKISEKKIIDKQSYLVITQINVKSQYIKMQMKVDKVKDKQKNSFAQNYSNFDSKPTLNNKMGTEIQNEKQKVDNQSKTGIQQKLQQPNENMSKKKKRKSKKKKIKQLGSEEQQTVQDLQQLNEDKNNKQGHNKYKQNINNRKQDKNCSQTIRFLKELKIDNKKRIPCNLENKFIQKCQRMMYIYTNKA